jgi:hypothetical protein
MMEFVWWNMMVGGREGRGETLCRREESRNKELRKAGESGVEWKV